MPLSRKDYFYYCRQHPPKDFNVEFNKIEEKLKIYPQNKIKFIEYYIEKNPWIKIFLYFDEFTINEINNSDNIIRNNKSASNYQDIFNNETIYISALIKKINDEIQKAGGIIKYLDVRSTHHLNDFFANRFPNMFSDNDIREEKKILVFIINLLQLIKEIECIEGLNQSPNPHELMTLTGKEPLFINFELKNYHNQLYDCLHKMERDKKIRIPDEKNWDDILSGQSKMIATLGPTDLMAFMQALVNNDFIIFDTIGKHCDRINAVFEPTEDVKDENGGFKPDTLRSLYTKVNKDNEFYKNKIKYFEKKIENSA